MVSGLAVKLLRSVQTKLHQLPVLCCVGRCSEGWVADAGSQTSLHTFLCSWKEWLIT